MTPPTPPPHEMTRLLDEWVNGDHAALERLLPLVEGELHRLARLYMRRERDGHTLQTTALVNEAYLRLAGESPVRWQNRAHFFAIAARTMRRILIDHARTRAYAKRGGGARKVSLEEAAELSSERAAELVALDEALEALAAVSERQARVVELRHFGGLTVEEAAEVLKVSPDTVTRDWRSAKAFLHRELERA